MGRLSQVLEWLEFSLGDCATDFAPVVADSSDAWAARELTRNTYLRETSYNYRHFCAFPCAAQLKTSLQNETSFEQCAAVIASLSSGKSFCNGGSIVWFVRGAYHSIVKPLATRQLKLSGSARWHQIMWWKHSVTFLQLYRPPCNVTRHEDNASLFLVSSQIYYKKR